MKWITYHSKIDKERDLRGIQNILSLLDKTSMKINKKKSKANEIKNNAKQRWNTRSFSLKCIEKIKSVQHIKKNKTHVNDVKIKANITHTKHNYGTNSVKMIKTDQMILGVKMTLVQVRDRKMLKLMGGGDKSCG